MLRVLPFLLGLALSIYAVIDCVRTDESEVRGLPKLAWVFVVLLFPIAGSIAWLVAGRPAGAPLPRLGAEDLPPLRPTGREPRPPKGPDDDPDFLNNL